MKEKKLVVFDMDGTLNRIELFIIPTYKEVLQKFAGAQADDDTVMRLMGCVDEQIYQGLLPGAPMERFDEFMALTAEAEYRNIDRYHGAFDGVPQMIRQLSEAGYMPNLVGCASCGEYASDSPGFSLDLLQGTLLCSRCRAEEAAQLEEPESYASACREQLLPDGVLAAMRHILYADFEKLFRFQLGGENLRRLGQVSEAFLLAQTERNYNTLDFLKDILPSGENT